MPHSTFYYQQAGLEPGKFVYYNQKRIKLDLKGLSPIQY
ncbi:IS3 family transposase [Aggregatibacter actinomycetemcomitans]